MGYYFDKTPTVKSNEVETKVKIKDKLYTFKTDNNVFSKKGLDFGTRSLLESIDMDDIHGDVLDLGCGYGPIGICIKLNTQEKTNVDMIDINERALNLAKKNARLNGVEVHVFMSDIYSNVSKKYHYIITNPPIRAGKKTLYEIVLGAKEHLLEHGTLILVIRKDQGAKSLISDLEKVYDIEVIKRNKGFFVIKCSL